MYCVIPMITMMLSCSLITPTKFWSLCESHLSVSLLVQPCTFTSTKDVSSNPSTVLHAVYPARTCTSTMQWQVATQLVSGSSAKQGTHALVLPCHSQPHTVAPGSLASLWRQRPSMHVCMLEQSMLCWWYCVQRLRAMGGKPFSGFTDRGLIIVLGLHQHSPVFQRCHILGIGDKAGWVLGQGDKGICNMKNIQHISSIFWQY